MRRGGMYTNPDSAANRAAFGGNAFSVPGWKALLSRLVEALHMVLRKGFVAHNSNHGVPKRRTPANCVGSKPVSMSSGSN